MYARIHNTMEYSTVQYNIIQLLLQNIIILHSIQEVSNTGLYTCVCTHTVSHLRIEEEIVIGSCHSLQHQSHVPRCTATAMVQLGLPSLHLQTLAKFEVFDEEESFLPN